MASVVNLHSRYAMIAFHRTIGVTIVSYVTQLHIAESQRLLVTTELAISTIATEPGFSSTSSFYSCFERNIGRSPTRYRR